MKIVWSKCFSLGQLKGGRSRKSRRGTSLVEVVMAFGIVTLVGIPIMGLLPMALKSLQNASFDTIVERVSERARADLQHPDLTGGIDQAIRFYDLEGREVSANDPTRVYDVYHSEVPYSMSGAASSLRRVSVQVVYNPSREGISVDNNGWATVPQKMQSRTLAFHVNR